VLLAKVVLVGSMVPLSVVAWRRRRPRPRAEGLIGLAVIAAAALLAAFPVTTAPAAQPTGLASGRATLGLPREGDLTLGGHAGQVLVGLTVRPARPGPNQVWVYLLPLEGEDSAGGLTASVLSSGVRHPLATCGSTCREAEMSLEGGEDLVVHVDGPKGGDAAFRLPRLPAPDSSAMLSAAQARMHGLRSYRVDETLSSGLVTVPSHYAYEAPNRMRASVETGSQVVFIGSTRYLRESAKRPWQVDTGGPELPVPTFIWDYFKPFVAPHLLGTTMMGNTRTMVISFFGGAKGGPAIWFRLWIDREGLVHRAEMRAIGHFMDDRIYDFDGPINIESPVAG
jgi:hypothetical protein